MNKALLNSMTVAEKRFLAKASRYNLDKLDEDQALDLHARARKLRDKYLTTYRRSAAEQVAQTGARGVAYEENQRERAKAEEFERALTQISRRVAKLSAQSAAELRAERLEMARAAKSAPSSGPTDGATPPPATADTAHEITSRGNTRRNAAISSTVRSNQSKRDKR